MISPFKLFKFGVGKDIDLPIGDTPVTRLSKIFQQTSFVGLASSQGENGASCKVESGTIPPDIDESANQEPPSKGYTTWFDANEVSTCSLPSSKPLIVRDSSASYSSGYCSSSSTQSAPPTCNIERSQFLSSSDQASLTDGTSLSVDRTGEAGAVGFSPSSHVALRRTQSCSTRGWLAKRYRRQPWPRISGITRLATADTSFRPQGTDTNSCPATFQTDRTMDANSNSFMRYSLPPVGEICASSDSSPPVLNDLFTKFELSPINTSNECISRHDQPDLTSPHPMAKRLRIESPSHSLLVTETLHKPELDSTTPLEDTSDEQHDEFPTKGSLPTVSRARPQPLFDMFRHQSTPMIPTRSLEPKCSIPSPVPTASFKSETKPSLSRCASVPVQTLTEKLSRCMSNLDGNNLRFDDGRPRALPVVDRTASGLHCVSTDTVAELVSRTSKNANVNHIIIDCRFPYEYEGGHIKDAINIYTHSDLIEEIFNRVPAQRPPGISGPPRLLGEILSRRLALTLKEPLSAPCEFVSDDDSLEEEDSFDQTTFGESSECDLATDPSVSDSVPNSRTEDSPSSRSEPEMSIMSQGSNCSSGSTKEHAFAVIFHCEFSSQRAPELATFLRSIDRVSNYHRYPFLYFPEIYVMKGGYSAFYRKYAGLCCPQNYVTMFHRGYRTELRFFKRLTKRVSSACLACIRPRPALLDMVDENNRAVTVESNNEAMNSFGQLSIPKSHPAMIAASIVNAATGVGDIAEPTLSSEARLAVIDSLVRNSDNVQNDHHVEDDKENEEIKEVCSWIAQPGASPLHISSQHSSICSPHGISFEIDRARSSSSERSDSESHANLSDSSLSLAEVVVRVGRRVIETTLSTVDPSSAELLKKFTQPNVIPSHGQLQRRVTVTGIDGANECTVLPRASKRMATNLIPFTICPEEPDTPAVRGLRRVQTLPLTPAQTDSSTTRSGWLHTESLKYGRSPDMAIAQQYSPTVHSTSPSTS